jgi:hypothetical protein
MALRWLSYKRVYDFRRSISNGQRTALFSFEGTNSREFSFDDAGKSGTIEARLV